MGEFKKEAFLILVSLAVILIVGYFAFNLYPLKKLLTLIGTAFKG